MGLLRDEVQFFIRANADEDEKALVLKHKKILGLPAAWIAEQLSGRRKAKEKLPTFYGTNSIIYPPSVSIEQSSSESNGRI